MSKQDRQGVRKASDIEQKYDLSSAEAAVNIANNAQRAATAARNAAETAGQAVVELDQSLDREGVTNRLTDDTGKITSADGTVIIDLLNNKITVTNLVINGKTVSWAANDDGTFTLKGS